MRDAHLGQLEEHMTRGKYKVFVALSEDISAPYIWVSNLPIQLQRKIVKLTNHDEDKSVVCQVLSGDQNFKKRYDQSANTSKLLHTLDSVVVMNGWYRDRLKTTKGCYADLEIQPICRWLPWLALIRASRSHPDYSIRLAGHLALLSVILGFVGLALGIISLCR